VIGRWMGYLTSGDLELMIFRTGVVVLVGACISVALTQLCGGRCSFLRESMVKSIAPNFLPSASHC
jgi:hypothetical protein